MRVMYVSEIARNKWMIVDDIPTRPSLLANSKRTKLAEMVASKSDPAISGR